MAQHLNGQQRPDSNGQRPIDHGSLQAIWREHRRWIAAVLLTYKPRSADLDDLLQEVAMTLVAKINTVRDEANLRAWLRVVAVNVARAAARTERSRPARSQADVSEYPASRIDRNLSDLSEEQRHIMSVVAQLPEAYREPLMLKAVHGLRTRQIAEALNIEEATVDTRVSRARRMLRELLDNTNASVSHRIPQEVISCVIHESLI